MAEDFGLSDEEIMVLQVITQSCRVNFDLLKANFGSSARAANILSWLETESFISKTA